MIRLAGHSEDEIRIEFSGLRAGEKLYEELLADTDLTMPSGHRQLRIARLGELDARALLARVAGVAAGTEDVGSPVEARRWLAQSVEEYGTQLRGLHSG